MIPKALITLAASCALYVACAAGPPALPRAQQSAPAPQASTPQQASPAPQAAVTSLPAPAQTASAVPGSNAPPRTLPGAKDSLKFAVIGDTGTGGTEQYDIARLLAQSRARFPFDFVLMVGDNMYGGESPGDFVNKFEKPYKPLLDGGVKFYAALGNHDDPAERFYKPFNMDGKRYYSFTKGDAEFFVLDSTYMSPAQVDWLKDALQKSKAKWKLAYFHHPIYSSGKTHGSEVDLQVVVEPLFLQDGVDVVFAGHEHFYERLKPQKGIYYFTEGGSAKLRKDDIKRGSPFTARGFDTDNTFMLVEIVKDQMFFETTARTAQMVDSGVIPRREVTNATVATR